MKKYLWGLATCTLILSSCNQNEVIDTLGQNEGRLSFGMAIGKQTKAAEWDNGTLMTEAMDKSKGIALYAYQKSVKTTAEGDTWAKWFTDKLFYDNATWKTDTTRFRNTAETKYFAIWPTAGISDYEDNLDSNFVDKGPSFKYTIQAPQVDLIGGITSLGKKQTDIVFKMRHLLSQINFGTKGYSGANIKFNSIKINKVKGEGTYTFKPSDTGAKKEEIGTWAASNPDVSYLYDSIYTEVPCTATTGDKYIFGDGGNAGPGRDKGTFYPIGNSSAWANAKDDSPTGLHNSLMLIPQDLKGATVTFEYQITDAAGAFVAGGPNDLNSINGFAVGTFNLNFNTNNLGTSGLDYLGKWEQNFRYVYIIDFTDFLNDNKLTFKVDVEAFPWENYDGQDGVVDVPVIGQPTDSTINKLTKDQIYYMASRKIDVQPLDKEQVQIVVNSTWDWSLYDFMQIENGQTFGLSFQNVSFNGKINLILPTGYTATKADPGIEITLSGFGTSGSPYIISAGDGSASAIITITNGNNEYSTSTTLQDGITAATNGNALIYKGTAAVDLTGMEPTGISTTGESITVSFTKGVVPTVGTSTNGLWTWNAITKTATWTRP